MVKCIVPTFCGISMYACTSVLTQELHERLYSSDSQQDTTKTKAFERLIYLFSVKTNAHTAETVQISIIQFVGRVAQLPNHMPSRKATSHTKVRISILYCEASMHRVEINIQWLVQSLSNHGDTRLNGKIDRTGSCGDIARAFWCACRDLLCGTDAR